MKAPAIVSFHGHNLLTARDGKTIRVAMKPITDAIGLQWEAQLKRIKRHPVLNSTVSMMDMVAEDGKKREVVTLPLEMLNGWLFGIDANRVKPEIRDTLLMYQRECFKVLFEHFHPQRVESCTLTHEHQRKLQKEISKHVYAKVKVGSLRRKAFSTIHTYLKDRFGVASYKDIAEKDYTQALAAVHAAPLQGVFIEHSEPTDKKDGIWLDKMGMNRVECLCSHFDAIYRIFRKYDLYGALTKLGSRAGVEMVDHIKDGTFPSHELQKLVSGSSHYDRIRLS